MVAACVEGHLDAALEADKDLHVYRVGESAGGWPFMFRDILSSCSSTRRKHTDCDDYRTTIRFSMWTRISLFWIALAWPYLCNIKLERFRFKM